MRNQFGGQKQQRAEAATSSEEHLFSGRQNADQGPIPGGKGLGPRLVNEYAYKYLWSYGLM